MIRALPFVLLLGCAPGSDERSFEGAVRAPLGVEDHWIVASVGAREFFLSDVPEDGTLDLTVEQFDVLYDFEEGWHYAFDARRNSVFVMEFVLEEGSVVTVLYQPAL